MNKFQLNLHNQIIASIDAIEELGISGAKKGSCYIGLAYEYFNMECDNLGFDLLIQIPNSYFENDMKKELEDPTLLDVTVSLINLMSQSRYDNSLGLEEMINKLRSHSNA